VPVLRTLADGGFQGPTLGNLGYRDEWLANVGEALGIIVEAIARGRDGRFVPAGICWVAEHHLRALEEHLIAFVTISLISILSRRLKRLTTEELGA
jgi:hypothetical protein